MFFTKWPMALSPLDRRSISTRAYLDQKTLALSANHLDRTIDQWRYLVDWNLQRQRPMVVIDPNDPEALMYLTERDYRDLQKVCLSNDMPLTVVARPGVSPPSGWQIPKEASQPSPSKDEQGQQPSKLEGSLPDPGDTRTGGKAAYGFYMSREGDAKSNTSIESNTSDPSSKPKYPKSPKRPPRPHFVQSGLWNQVRATRSWLPSRLEKIGATVRQGMVDIETSKQLLELILMWGRQTAHYLELGRPGYRMRLLSEFGKYVIRIWSTQGMASTIQLMKIYLFTVYSYLGGDPLSSTEPLGRRVRLRRGLPACFPKEVRLLLRSGHVDSVRWWASTLNAYKALSAPHTLTECLNSIEAPTFEGDFGDWAESIIEIWSRLSGILGFVPHYKGGHAMGRFSVKAGPNSSVAILGMYRDALAWAQSGKNYLVELARIWTPLADRVGNDLTASDEAIPGSFLLAYKEAANSAAWAYSKSPKRRSPILSKLALILESAGKVRPVAICDIWTQWLLYPFHEYIFTILRRIPQDATFNQGIVKTYALGFDNETKHYCYDLKSATDRIPIQLYIEMLIPLIGRTAADLWARILVDRPFNLPRILTNPCKENGNRPPYPNRRTVRYTRGQPMGAYSSWATLALVHHFLVQKAALQCGFEEWFTSYLVLGDDIVISDHGVAQAYLSLCDSYGITVGLAKSFTCKGLLNFASKTFYNSQNVSPVSLKEELSATRWAGRIALANRCLDMWYGGEQKGMSQLRRVVSNTCWTLLQSELQAREPRGLVHALSAIAQSPLFEKAEKFDASLIMRWIGTYVLSPTSKQPIVSANFARDLVKVFVDAGRRIAQENLKAAKRYLEVLECSTHLGVIQYVFGGDRHLSEILRSRGSQFFENSRRLLVDIEAIAQAAEPPTTAEINEVLMGRTQTGPVVANQPSPGKPSGQPEKLTSKGPPVKIDKATMGAFWKAFQMATGPKREKQVLHGRAIPPKHIVTKEGIPINEWQERQRCLDVVLPQAVAAFVEASRWRILPKDRLLASKATMQWFRLPGLTPAEMRNHRPMYRIDLSLVTEIRYRSKELRGILERLGPLQAFTYDGEKKQLVLEVPDFTHVLKGESSPPSIDTVKLPLVELEAVLLRHFGIGASLPDLAAVSMGKQERALLTRALRSWHQGAKETISPISRGRLLENPLETLYIEDMFFLNYPIDRSSRMEWLDWWESQRLGVDHPLPGGGVLRELTRGEWRKILGRPVGNP